MGNKLCLDMFWQNFINNDQNPSVEIWLKSAQCHICCKKVMLLWSSWLGHLFSVLGAELQRGYWLRFDVQFSIFWKFSSHLTYANQTSISVEILTGIILPGFSNKVRYMIMHSQEDQFHLKWFVTWTKKMWTFFILFIQYSHHWNNLFRQYWTVQS